MNSVWAKGWRPLLILLIGFVVGLIVAKSAEGAEPLSSAMARLPVYGEDKKDPELKAVQIQDVARAIEQASAKAPRPGKDWQALLVAIAYHESSLSIRIQRGACRPLECDRGRARGPWQQHRSTLTAPVWELLVGLAHTDIQAEYASKHLTQAYWQCSRSGVHWLTGTINAYSGRRCGDQSWPGRLQREATWAMVRRRL